MNKEIKITKAYYEKNAKRWANHKTDSFHHEAPFKKFAVLLKKGSKVLDIGCANGIHVPLFLGMGRHIQYEGMDISKAMLKIAQARYPQLSFKQGDIADKHTLPKKKFDGFFAAAVLMHVPFQDWNEMFANIIRLMKKGAIGYITLPIERPNPASPEDQRHFTLLSKNETETFFKNMKWKIVSSGLIKGTYKGSMWIWYIVQLP